MNLFAKHFRYRSSRPRLRPPAKPVSAKELFAKQVAALDFIRNLMQHAKKRIEAGGAPDSSVPPPDPEKPL